MSQTNQTNESEMSQTNQTNESEITKPTCLKDLPIDLLTRIFGFCLLTRKEICDHLPNISRVSQLWKSIAQSDFLWQVLYPLYFGNEPQELESCWYKQYQKDFSKLAKQSETLDPHKYWLQRQRNISLKARNLRAFWIMRGIDCLQKIYEIPHKVFYHHQAVHMLDVYLSIEEQDYVDPSHLGYICASCILLSSNISWTVSEIQEEEYDQMTSLVCYERGHRAILNPLKRYVRWFRMKRFVKHYVQRIQTKLEHLHDTCRVQHEHKILEMQSIERHLSKFHPLIRLEEPVFYFLYHCIAEFVLQSTISLKYHNRTLAQAIYVVACNAFEISGHREKINETELGINKCLWEPKLKGRIQYGHLVCRCKKEVQALLAKATALSDPTSENLGQGLPYIANKYISEDKRKVFELLKDYCLREKICGELHNWSNWVVRTV